MADLSKEFRMYLAIWRKAYRERDSGKPVEVHASSFTLALAIRQGMYRAIRPYRQGKQFDPELSEAAEIFVIAAPRNDENPSGPHTIYIKPRATLSELERELARLGIDVEDQVLFEEKLLEAELDELIEKPIPRAATPFYTRED